VILSLLTYLTAKLNTDCNIKNSNIQYIFNSEIKDLILTCAIYIFEFLILQSVFNFTVKYVTKFHASLSIMITLYLCQFVSDLIIIDV